VAFQVVHGDEREGAGVGQSLRRRDPDEEGPDQTRPYRHSDAADFIERDLGVRQ
jgi:hypothetical protein